MNAKLMRGVDCHIMLRSLEKPSLGVHPLCMALHGEPLEYYV